MRYRERERERERERDTHTHTETRGGAKLDAAPHRVARLFGQELLQRQHRDFLARLGGVHSQIAGPTHERACV